MNRPVLLDLFCGAGGCSVGYYRAGFDVVGVDIKPQPRYPAFHDALYASHFKFIQADALTYPLEGFDAYHASPPCQFGSIASRQWKQAGKVYPNLIPEVRARLLAAGRPFIIENVVGEPHLKRPTKLNGNFFGMALRRTRFFETSFPVDFFLLPPDGRSYFRTGRPVREGEAITPVGHFSGVAYARRVMGIEWMTGQELTQAIPPAYTKFIGNYLIAELERLERTQSPLM